MHDDVIRAMRAAERLRRWARQGTWRRMAHAGAQVALSEQLRALSDQPLRAGGVMVPMWHSLQGWVTHRAARSH